MKSLADHDVYTPQPNLRKERDTPAPDVISNGLAALVHGNATNPFSEFNGKFQQLQERYKLEPVGEAEWVAFDTNLPATPPASQIPVTPPNENATEKDAESLAASNSGDEKPISSSEGESELDWPDSPTLQLIGEGDVTWILCSSTQKQMGLAAGVRCDAVKWKESTEK